MALAATYASGGEESWINGREYCSSIASQNGFIAAMLIKNGLTCQGQCNHSVKWTHLSNH